MPAAPIWSVDGHVARASREGGSPSIVQITWSVLPLFFAASTARTTKWATPDPTSTVNGDVLVESAYLGADGVGCELIARIPFDFSYLASFCLYGQAAGVGAIEGASA